MQNSALQTHLKLPNWESRSRNIPPFLHFEIPAKISPSSGSPNALSYGSSMVYSHWHWEDWQLTDCGIPYLKLPQGTHCQRVNQKVSNWCGLHTFYLAFNVHCKKMWICCEILHFNFKDEFHASQKNSEANPVFLRICLSQVIQSVLPSKDEMFSMSWILVTCQCQAWWWFWHKKIILRGTCSNGMMKVLQSWIR
jgi:hypothetical protein